MKKIRVNAGRPYDVVIGKGEINNLPSAINKLGKSGKIAVVTDRNVGGLYGEKITALLGGKDVCYVEIESGEEHKSMNTVADILEKLAKNKLTRSDLIVALGGGIVGDVAGFAAACYLRGVDFVQVPTTLLAMVDSSVGGKTGVNLSAGKNLAGAFHQPRLVVCDEDFLATLPEEEFKNGMGEVIKYGCIADKNLLEKLSSPGGGLEEIIARCVEIKADFVAKDEFDNGERQKLNFGHTLGHAIEKASGFAVPHGQAVGIGMRVICRWAEERGLTPKGCADAIEALTDKFGMIKGENYRAEDLWNIAANDKKLKGKNISLVLLKELGSSYLYKTTIDALENS